MTLVLYLLRRFFPVFIGAVSFFALVLGLVDLLMNLFNYISNQVAFSVIFRISILYLPKTLSFALPLAILFAVSYTLSDLYAKNELTAVFASGVSLFSFTLPLLLLSIVLSFGFFYFEDIIVVPTYAEKVRVQNESLGRTRSEDNDQLVIMTDGGHIVYKADYYNNTNQTLHYLTIVLRTEDFLLDMIIKADDALWNGSYWELSHPVCYILRDNIMRFEEGLPDGVMERLSEPPETFRSNVVSVEEISIAEAREYLARLRRTGFPYAEAQAQYYKKFSFPAIMFIVVFLSIGLSGKSRKNVLLVSLILSVGAAVCYYVTQMVAMLFAQFGLISPLEGAWAPVVLFTFVSIALLKYART